MVERPPTEAGGMQAVLECCVVRLLLVVDWCAPVAYSSVADVVCAGQFQRRCCPKGKKCNFLHVFTNPGNTFWRADRDLPPPPSIEDRHRLVCCVWECRRRVTLKADPLL